LRQEYQNASPEDNDNQGEGQVPPADFPNVVASSFLTGSDVEIAERLSEFLNKKFGDIAYCESKFWCYADTQWKEIRRNDLWLLVAQYDGHAHGKKNSIIRLGKTRIESILAHLEKLFYQPGFFKRAARGVNCLSGFVELAADSALSLQPHCAGHRQRHTIPAHWSSGTLTIPTSSLLHTLLHGSLEGDPEKEQKLEVLARLAGAVRYGIWHAGHQPHGVRLKGREQSRQGPDPYSLSRARS
jgi:hypothetical protein